jgi:phosphoenolpyruvate carboxykinase (ATP)
LSIQSELESQLKSLGIASQRPIHHGLTSAEHTEFSVRNGEGICSNDGALVVNTGSHTGRAPNDKYIVQDDSLKDIWWGMINQPLAPETYQVLLKAITAHLGSHELYIDDVYVGQDPNHRLAVRLISTQAWYGLFARNLFIPTLDSQVAGFKPDVTILHAPEIDIDPKAAGIHSSTFIVLNLIERMILNYLMPKEQVFPMHCSANVGIQGDVALFFGLSGTGKTTLSSSPDRQLIGDDEHGWSSEGIFNFEGGCYAKTIKLSAEFEPLIWSAVHRFGALIENVVIDPDTRAIDFNSDKITENTRAAYPLSYIDNYFPGQTADHPKNVFFLTADASGVLPPIARLWLHLEAGGHRDQPGLAAPGYLLLLLRRALPAAAPNGVRRYVRRAHPPA